ncbi:unnamed protein product [Lactuca saligna]|uniref:Uncharacterized protein n=1 Tax=Lactuca saligna TaxID=75948 RepID=A0AA36EMT4_LACSI|nr:unnamed protein product [Lactuca saligna]
MPAYVPYPCWLGLILAYDKESYNVNHVYIITIPALSTKIINAAPSNGDMHITQKMVNWIANTYTVESSESEEEDDEDEDKYNEEGDVDQEGTNDEDEANDEEDVEDEEDELATGKREASV